MHTFIAGRERIEYQEVLIELKHIWVLQVLISHTVNCERKVSRDRISKYPSLDK